MDLDVLQRLQAFKLREEEVGDLHLDASDIQLSREECRHSIIGKVFGDKQVNFVGLRNTLTSIWSTIGPFKIRELGTNLFHFVFTNTQDQQKVLHGTAWTFDGHFLVMKPWREDLNLNLEDFSKICL